MWGVRTNCDITVAVLVLYWTHTSNTFPNQPSVETTLMSRMQRSRPPIILGLPICAKLRVALTLASMQKVSVARRRMFIIMFQVLRAQCVEGSSFISSLHVPCSTSSCCGSYSCLKVMFNCKCMTKCKWKRMSYPIKTVMLVFPNADADNV